jgi:hypothetical protein
MEEELSSVQALNKETHSQLILTLDRANCALQLGGYTLNYNEAINMLGMALREFQAMIDQARALEGKSRVAAPAIWPGFGRKH